MLYSSWQAPLPFSHPPSLSAVSLELQRSTEARGGPKGQSEGYQFLSSDPSLNSLFVFIRRLSLPVCKVEMTVPYPL